LTGPISSEFDSLSLLSWLATGYLIANSACQPLSGKLTDIFSRRTGFIFSNFFFALGTLVCGLAPNAPAIIAGRVIAGVGGGGLTCIATFVTSDLVPLRRRGLWQGYGNIVFGMGMGLGGVVGGAFADNISWRWAFLFQLPFIVVSAIMVWFLVDIPVNPSTQPPLSRIDFLGAITLALSLVLLLLGLNTGGNQLPWSHPLIITSLVLSLVVLSAFLYIETNPSLAPEPMIPVSLIIRSRTVFTSYGVNWYSIL
jgi:MFS family permease